MADRRGDDPFERIVELAVTITIQRMSDHYATSFAELKRSLVADLYKELAGQYIPKNTLQRRVERDERIIAAHCAGRAVADLAREFHLSDGAIRRIMGKRRESN